MTEDRRYPLCWPEGWKRASSRSRAAYKVSEEQAKKELLHAVKLLGGTKIILSTNIVLRQDGLPYSNQPKLYDPGVAIYFTRKGKEQAIACDRWDLIKDNYRAIFMVVEALRSMERCGASEMLDRAFAGFTALPAAGESTKLNWRLELGLPERVVPTKEQIEDAYRALAKARHPDVPGGSHDAFVRLTQAKNMGLKECGYG
jgi:hypothetical protein